MSKTPSTFCNWDERAFRTQHHPHTGARAAPQALARLCHTYKIVGSSGEIVRAEHVERDPGLGVEVQPPLVHVFGEDQVKRVPGAPFLGGVHQLFELHPAWRTDAPHLSRGWCWGCGCWALRLRRHGDRRWFWFWFCFCCALTVSYRPVAECSWSGPAGPDPLQPPVRRTTPVLCRSDVTWQHLRPSSSASQGTVSK